MNLKKIIVYQHQTLFEILDEIKEKFNFSLFLANKKNLLELKKNFKGDFLIISNSANLDFDNLLVINDFPIKIEKLLQLINLKFIKTKFINQSEVTVGLYKLNLNSREISKNNIVTDLTEREINLILFLKNNVSAVKIDELQKKVWEYGPELETHTVETHIYRLRKKIKDSFNDENFILSTKKGYTLN